MTQPGSSFLYGAVSSVSGRALALCDLLKAVNTLTGTAVPVPSWLPG